MGAINGTNAQVTIGALDIPEVTLDVIGQATEVAVPDGVLIPRITGDQLAAKTAYNDVAQNSTLIFVTAAASTGNQTGQTSNVKSEGFYYFDYKKNKWIPLACEQSSPQEKPEWFYMPPYPIEVTSGLTGETIDLFEKFIESLTTLSFSSVTSASFSDFYDISGLKGDDFDYYVVGYDASLFGNISIDEDGLMTYDIIGTADDKSYINIVFVRK